MSHNRAQTYDGPQMGFTFPSQTASAVSILTSEGSVASPSLQTESNVTVPITELGSLTNHRSVASNKSMDADIPLIKRRSSLKRSKAVRSRIGWLSKRLKQFGSKFLRKISSGWRKVTKRTRVSLLRMGKTSKRPVISAPSNFMKLTKNGINGTNTHKEQGKSIAELKREIDNWYVPHVQQIPTPPPLPPHRVISTPLLEVPKKKLIRSLSKASRTYSQTTHLSRSISRTSIAEQKTKTSSDNFDSITTEHILQDQHALEDILYAYFSKIINDRIQTKLNIANLSNISQSRQPSYIRHEILNESDSQSVISDEVSVWSNDSDNNSVSSTNTSVVDSDSDSYSINSSSIVSSSVGYSIANEGDNEQADSNSLSSSNYFSAYSKASEAKFHHHSSSSPTIKNKRLLSQYANQNDLIRRYSSRIFPESSVNRSNTLPVDYGASRNSRRFDQLLKVSEYTVQVPVVQ